MKNHPANIGTNFFILPKKKIHTYKMFMKAEAISIAPHAKENLLLDKLWITTL